MEIQSCKKKTKDSESERKQRSGRYTTKALKKKSATIRVYKKEKRAFIFFNR